MHAEFPSAVEHEATSTPEPEIASDSEQEDDEESRAGPLRWLSETSTRLELFWKAITIAFGIVLAVWTATKFFVAERELHLAVWVKNDTLLYPVGKKADHDLPLAYDDDPVRSLASLDVEISNFGRRMIGDQKERWELELEMSDAEHLTVVGEPVCTPKIAVAKVKGTSEPNIVRLAIGAMEPDTTVNLQLMAANFRTDAPRRLEARPSLAGLPHQVEDASPLRRVQGRLRWPAFLTTFLAFGATMVVFAYGDRRTLAQSSPWNLALQLAFAGLMLAIAASMVAGGISEALAWLVLQLS